MAQQNLYDFLGISRDADVAEINKAFREKALQYHPDKNKTDPEASRKFKFLTQAYQVLNDPQRRKKYDATLPASVSSSVVQDLTELWTTAGQIFLQQAERYTPAVDAIRESRPILVDDDRLLIVGIEYNKSSLISHLSAGVAQNHLRRIISDLYGKPLDFRIITGTTEEEWQAIKQAEEKVRAKKLGGRMGSRLAAKSSETIATTSAQPDHAWDDLLTAMMQRWSATTQKNYPQTRARFAVEQAQMISRVEDMSRAAGMPDEEMERLLARTIDQLAGLTGIESGVVALDYIRVRARLLGGM